MKYFAVKYDYPADSEGIASVRPIHREFIGTLLDDGKIVGSGPFADGEGGALIVIQLANDATIDDAHTLMDRDPFYAEGVITGRSIREWNPVINSFES